MPGGSDKTEKNCGEQGGFKQGWAEHVIFIMAVVWFGLSPTGHLQTPAADSWKPAWVQFQVKGPGFP